MARELDLVLAAELAGKTRPRKGKCWLNSLSALMGYRYDVGKELPADAFYVEGWLMICDGAIPIEHGWIELGDKIVDVTLYKDGDLKAEYYFPVLRWSIAEMMSVVHSSRRLPLYQHSQDERVAMMSAYRDLPCNQWIDEYVREHELRKERES